jgi:hypothetical protein
MIMEEDTWLYTSTLNVYITKQMIEKRNRNEIQIGKRQIPTTQLMFDLISGISLSKLTLFTELKNSVLIKIEKPFVFLFFWLTELMYYLIVTNFK